ncbi:hypothetical protein M8C21_001852 [Ambrosia artemisiifolia]|uniref:Uncharacterized protein n=1 Tax=Ambrosia artemisiifolia TaxID=4212 RepID=A0AAD5C8A7_AMBAR|nr:hypothetical protein M8C21_001852 [Ambrosia artemisiifolia]
MFKVENMVMIKNMEQVVSKVLMMLHLVDLKQGRMARKIGTQKRNTVKRERERAVCFLIDDRTAETDKVANYFLRRRRRHNQPWLESRCVSQLLRIINGGEVHRPGERMIFPMFVVYGKVFHMEDEGYLKSHGYAGT